MLCKLELERYLDSLQEDVTKLQGAHIFITGGTGFIGKWLVEMLLAADRAFTLNLNFTLLTRNPEHAIKSNSILEDQRISVIKGDIRQLPWPNGNYTHFIHAAADTSLAGLKDHYGTIETIVDGTRNYLSFIKSHSPESVLFLSSGAVYGDIPYNEPANENKTTSPSAWKISSSYGLAKLLAEHYCFLGHKTYNLPIKVARCFTFLGPYFPLEGHYAICNFIRDALEKRNIVVQGSGQAVRSYLYAADLAVWLLKILLHDSSDIFNVGSDIAISIKDLAHKVSQTLSAGGVQVLGKDDASYHDFYVPNTDHAKSVLGVNETTSLEEAILRTATWYKMRF